ncbi:hypothetical protein LTR17_018544 [Elasticomyces elasticus]|nr:hypothetical protein LTR17_018544 [Elasticomyces elasticus]
MRLLDISTLQFRDFGDDERPPYAIASHRWGSEEATYKDVQSKRNVTGPGYLKILNFCQLVKRLEAQIGPSKALDDLGLRRRSCINKEDGPELSEAINSMFRWYADAAVCYAYLADVKSTQKFRSTTLDLMRSQWFKRGWTLQEMIAPRTVVFVANNWDVLGHKCSYSEQVCSSVCQGFGGRLNKVLAQVTSIPSSVVGMPSLDQLRRIGVEEKLSWTKRRATTRPEDQAYCLLGLLDVFIAPIYGEGENAWTRLMQAVDYKHSIQPSSSGVKNPKHAMWFRLRGVKKEVKKGSHFTSKTMTTTEVSGYSTGSMPVGRVTHSYPHEATSDPFPLAMTQSDAYGPMSVPLPPTTQTHSISAGAMSIPAETSVSYNFEASTSRYHQTSAPELGPTTAVVHEARTSHTPHQKDPATQQKLGLDSIGEHGITDDHEVTDSTVPEQTSTRERQSILKHRYGSAWSHHNGKVYGSTWYHELPTASPLLECDVPTLEKSEVCPAGFGKVKALFDFVPSATDELAFVHGDVITVTDVDGEGWWKGELRGSTGLFPLNYVAWVPVVTETPRQRTITLTESVVSTLPVDEEPGLLDWIKHDSATFGMWEVKSDSIVHDSVEPTLTCEVKASASRSDSIPEAPAESRLLSQWLEQTSQRITNEECADALGKSHHRGNSSADECLESVKGSQDGQFRPHATSLRPPRKAITQTVQRQPQSSAVVEAGKSTAKILPMEVVQHVTTSLEITRGYLHEDDSEGSIQTEDLNSDHWRDVDRPMEPLRRPDGISPRPSRWQGGHPHSTGAQMLGSPDITIPKVVLRALIDHRPDGSATLDEANLLASTAVEYIRSLLLSEQGTQPHTVNRRSRIMPLAGGQHTPDGNG